VTAFVSSQESNEPVTFLSILWRQIE